MNSSALRISLALAAIGWLAAGPANAQSVQEVHDRIVAIMERSGVELVAPDTFVTWSPRPVLYHTVSRSAEGIQSALIRADGLAGVAKIALVRGQATGAQVTWWRAGERLRDIVISVTGDSLHVRDTVNQSYPLPKIPWAIADYGMDDLLVPAFLALAPDGHGSLTVFRPYAVKWDTLDVRVRIDETRRYVEVGNAPDDLWTLVLSEDDAVLQILRSKYPHFERRPLEQSSRVGQYMILRRTPTQGSP